MEQLTKESASLFESIRHIDEEGVEYWSSRELAKALEYSDYRNFLVVIEKAKEACKNSSQDVLSYFGELTEIAKTGIGKPKPIKSVKLSRYACYLVVQNADPSKAIVAQGQTYFAIQTRYAEIQQMEEYQRLTTEEEMRLFLRQQLREHNSELADAAKNAGVKEPWEYARFQNAGYKGLYNGLDEDAIHTRKDLKKSQRILDHMGSTELAANLFRATQTAEKLKRENVQGKENANNVHYEVGKKVRKAIADIGGTMPEDLPSVESIRKIESKQKRLTKGKSSGLEEIEE